MNNIINTVNGTFVEIHTQFSPNDFEMVKINTIVGYSQFTSKKDGNIKYYLMFNYPIAGSSHSLEVTQESYNEVVDILTDVEE